MAELIESYYLGSIKVQVKPTDDEQKYLVHCKDGEKEVQFKASVDEFNNYRKLMNRRIKTEFKNL